MNARELPAVTTQPRLVEVRKNVLNRNDQVARALRQRFLDAGVFVVSLVSSPGSGKTAFLEKTLTLLAKSWRVAALVGDLATDNDAARLARSGAPVKQITTGTLCHLEAAMVESALEEWRIGGLDCRELDRGELDCGELDRGELDRSHLHLGELDFLFIENVGNLVCPSSYDLGEDLRLVLLSVTEGEDKPLKYPTIFHTSDIAIITKMDLAEAVEFDSSAADRNIQSVRPGMQAIGVSSKNGFGMDHWIELLTSWRMRRPPSLTTATYQP